MKIVIIVAVLVTGLIMLGNAQEIVDCSGPNDHLKQCRQDKICAWTRKKCKCVRPDNKHCQLKCMDDTKEWCNGLSDGDLCSTYSTYRCRQYGRYLMCLRQPLLDLDI